MFIKSALVTLVCICLSVSCTADSTPADHAPPQELPSTETTHVFAIRALLQPFEDVAVAIEAREAAAPLSPDWRSAWSEITAARQDPHIATLALLLRGAASDEQLLATGATAMNGYIQSFDAMAKLMDQEAESQVLDKSMVALHERLVAALQQVGQSDGRATARSRDFCCVVKLSDPTVQPVPCFQWHTIGVWAGAKCVAAGIGLNRTGSTLYGGICQDHPECF